MIALWMILSALAAIGALVCWIIILIDAFQDEIWRGILGLLCWIYLAWYAVFDFEHEYKWPLIIGAFGGSTIAAGLQSMVR